MWFLTRVAAVGIGCHILLGCNSENIVVSFCAQDDSPDAITLTADGRFTQSDFFGEITSCGGQTSCIKSPFPLAAPPHAFTGRELRYRWMVGGIDFEATSVSLKEDITTSIRARDGSDTYNYVYSKQDGILSVTTIGNGYARFWKRCGGELFFDDLDRISLAESSI